MRATVLGLIAGAALAVGSISFAEEKAATGADDAPNTLTHGMVQMTLKVGETKQLQVLETFGAPNITTLDGASNEVWIYDRHATVAASDSKSFSIGMLVGAGGGGVAGGGGLGFGKTKSQSDLPPVSSTEPR